MKKNAIICPSCNTAFKVDETNYAAIVKQIRDEQFQAEIEGRLQLAAKEKEHAVALAEEKLRNELDRCHLYNFTEELLEEKYLINLKSA